jgi:drug/metabolite transporter (DMT)-like permease
LANIIIRTSLLVLLQKMSKEKKQLTWAMILSMIVWGISWPSNGVLTHYGSPTALGVFRYVFVILSLLILLFILKIPLRIKREGILFILAAGMLMAVYNFTFLQGLHEGSPGAGGILVTTLNPIIAYALGMLIDWKKPGKFEFIGLACGVLAGLILLRVWENSSVFLDGGNIFFLLSALIWAVMSKFTAGSSKYGSSFAFTWWMYVVTLVSILPFAEMEEVVALTASTELLFWGNLLFASIITTTLATTVYFYATAKIGAEKASSFIFTVPFSAALSSFLILGEKIEWPTIVGGFIGILAVWLINRK